MFVLNLFIQFAKTSSITLNSYIMPQDITHLVDFGNGMDSVGNLIFHLFVTLGASCGLEMAECSSTTQALVHRYGRNRMT